MRLRSDAEYRRRLDRGLTRAAVGRVPVGEGRALIRRSRTFPDGEGQNRTGDTTIFSRVLYRLSYLAAVVDGTAWTPARPLAADGRPLRGSQAATAAGAASPRRAASTCSRLSREEISTAASNAPRRAKPAPTRNASWKPSVSATAGLRSPEANTSSVREVATVARIASPSAPPTCWEVLMSPEARPASSWFVPVTAAIVTGTNAKPSPTAATSDG